MNLTDLVKYYYTKRGLTFPNFDNSMKFFQTELAEVYELDLDRIGGWVRNNPQNKPKFSKSDLAEELGDAIMMLIVAGISEGVDPVEALEKKIDRKLNVGKKVMTGVSSVVPLTDAEAKRIFAEVDEDDRIAD